MIFGKLNQLKITYSQLLLYGVHVGHSFSNSLLYSSWLVYTHSDNILIINLYKSIFLWKSGFFGLAYACKYKSPIWFINLDTSFAHVLKYSSSLAGEICWTADWVHGILSNFPTFASIYRKLRKYSSLAHKGRQKWVTKYNTEWLLTRNSWPRAIFVSSVYNSYWPVREALTLGVACFGVVDTNTACNYVSIPFPGNDDSISCLIFYILRLQIIYYIKNLKMLFLDFVLFVDPNV